MICMRGHILAADNVGCLISACDDRRCAWIILLAAHIHALHPANR